MKYVIISIVAIAAVFGLSFLITGLIRRKLKRKPPMWGHILISIGSGVAALGVAFLIFANIHYPADEEARKVLNDPGSIKVSGIEGGYMLDGEGKDTALVFYPGAKVDAESYLPLMKRLAENGVDCFLLKPPMGMAIFDMNAAERIVGKYDYDKWLLSGHSMGGIAAAGCATDNPEKIYGVVLLASYPNRAMNKDTRLLSIYGSEDKVLEHGAYEDAKSYFPQNAYEVIIEGGNHAGFGNYGKQNGDGTAAISSEEQQEKTVEEILKLLENEI